MHDKEDVNNFWLLNTSCTTDDANEIQLYSNMYRVQNISDCTYVRYSDYLCGMHAHAFQYCM